MNRNHDKVALPISVRSATHIKDQEGQLFGITEAKNGDIWYGHERGVCKFKSGDLSSGLTSLNCFENI